MLVRDPGSERGLCRAARRARWTSAASVLTTVSASLSCPLLQPPTSGPFTSSFGGAGFSDDPFKSKQDTPALPPKKPAPPRPKPPSGQYAFFSHSHPPTVARWLGHRGPLCSPTQSRADAAGSAVRAIDGLPGSHPPCAWGISCSTRSVSCRLLGSGL